MVFGYPLKFTSKDILKLFNLIEHLKQYINNMQCKLEGFLQERRETKVAEVVPNIQPSHKNIKSRNMTVHFSFTNNTR